MLKVLRNHIYAAKLQQVLSNSTMVVVYQALGVVDVSRLKQQLQEALDERIPESGLQVDAFRVRNSVTGGAGDAALSNCFHASNVVVGWQVGGWGVDGLRASRNSSFEQLFGLQPEGPSQPGSSGAAPSPLPSVPNSCTTALIDLSLKLPDQQPVALMGAFHQRKPVRLSQLRKWITLDERQVHHEMLTELESVPMALCGMDESVEGLMTALDSASPQQLLQCAELLAMVKAEQQTLTA